MSLPPGFIDELRGRVSLAAVAGRRVTWDQRKSNRGRGDMWAPCPFHQEKTPSFHVDDGKGFYYCFGCHEKGDVFGFVQKTENVDFMEAVRLLATEAGMALPDRDPRAAERAQKRAGLHDVMEMAVAWYRRQLASGPTDPTDPADQLGAAAGERAGTGPAADGATAGEPAGDSVDDSAGGAVAAGRGAAQARDYLARRGLDVAACARWGIGFVPPGGGVLEHLAARGVTPAQMAEAGLSKPSDDGRAPYERFQNRIVFPIRDAPGRAIALGGRAMDPKARAKYLNSPETPLFDKGRTLFNIGPARAAAGRAPLIVAEGYMDVIALVEAGFGAAVAPLGTAITEDQLIAMWRLPPEPILALDGDSAGLGAAMRLVGLALPLLEAGRSLRFCLMPPNRDPDDVIRAGGAPAMQALLDAAAPLVAMLWRRETEGRDFDSPERRAALDGALDAAVATIRDANLRRHYGQALRDMRWRFFDPRRKAGARGAGGQAGTRASALVNGGDRVGDAMREAVILSVLIAHPGSVADRLEALEAMDCADPHHAAVAGALLSGARGRAAVRATAGDAALERLDAWDHLRLAPALWPDARPETISLCLNEELAKLASRWHIRREIADAIQDVGAGVGADEGLTWRLAQAAAARHRADRIGAEDRMHYEVGANGARVDRAERDAFAALLARIGPRRAALTATSDSGEFLDHGPVEDPEDDP